jgi:phosphoribosylglycinamide formyltransferase-1
VKRIAVFASGAGSNFKNIVSHFSESNIADVELLVSNRSNCGAVSLAEGLGIPVFIVRDTSDYKTLGELIARTRIDLIVLAGYLKLVPAEFIKSNPRMINIHPSLLPAYGGKGMYGIHVHRAVFNNEEKRTGISIHEVNEHFDEGKILAQYETDISLCSSPEEIENKVRQLEISYFPKCIEKLLRDEL